MGNYGSNTVSWLFPRPSTAIVPTATPDIVTPAENNENIKRIDQTYQWILVHAPGVHPTHALAYAHLLFDAKLGNIDRIGRKLAKEPQLLESLGFEADDAEEIFDSLRLAGLLGGDNATLISDVSSTHYTTHNNNNNAYQMALLKQQAKKLGPEHAITLSTVTNIGETTNPTQTKPTPNLIKPNLTQTKPKTTQPTQPNLIKLESYLCGCFVISFVVETTG